jgi:signal transduction histidine kinase/ligand-binding sensor domain-containing protein/DNA-binding response OmpR family regulator
MTTKNAIWFLFLLQLVITGAAQPAHINFTSLTSKDGLVSNTVNAIIKDRYGLMWFATDDGLNKFDGTNFTVYRHIPGDSSSLRANEVLTLHEDVHGDLWIGTSGGAVSRYDRKKDRFIHFPMPGDNSGLVPNAVVRGICSDQQGNIWIAQFESPYKINPNSGKIAKVELQNISPVTPTPFSLECILADHKGRIWVGTNNGLFVYQPATNSFKPFLHDPSNSSSLIFNDVRSLAEDRAGHLWVGTEAGLCVMNSPEGRFTGFDKTNPSYQVLATKPINSIVPDSNGKLWIGTMEGLHVLDPQSGKVLRYLPDGNSNGLTSKAVKTIYIDKEGIYWLGTDLGGINRYDKNLNLFDVRLADAFLPNSTKSVVVSSFAERADGKVWIGTDGSGLYCFDRTSGQLKPVTITLPHEKTGNLEILSLKAASNGILYIGTLGQGLLLLDPATQRTTRMTIGQGPADLNGDEIYSILEDSKGQLWIGTNGQGVNVVKNNKVIARYTPLPVAGIDTLLPLNGYIRALEEDHDGNIWIGTHGGGLAIYHPSDKRFTIYTTNNSRLPIDKIHTLLCDNLGRMWIGTYGGGLCRFDKKSGQFINYTEKDGLPNTTVYQLVADATGNIWISTNTGVSHLDPTTNTFRNFTHNNGLQNSNFVHGAGIRLSDGELLFGGVQGFNYFNPANLTINRNVPTVMLTDLQIANKSVQPGATSAITDPISEAAIVRLDYKQNFALSFVALNYTLPKKNQYAYKLEGFDRDWNYSGTINTARYTNLDPGNYVFRVKASNNDGVWSKGDKSIRIYVKPPIWRTAYAYVFYVIAAFCLLLYSRHRGLSRERKKFQLERERAEVHRTRELDRMKLKFLTNLSHEFRTPISLIMGPVDELLTEQREQRAKDKLYMVRRNARRLLNLVNQLLDFRKMEEQELRLLLAEGELVSYIRDVVLSFSDLSERKHIRLNFTSNLQRLHAQFDHDKVERILFNLLSNAFKFTSEEGRISVELEAASKPDTNGMTGISIRVTDTGIGIPADQLQRIFDRFFQHASGDAVLNQGTGLGLSITKEFVRLHGGTIGVESEVGRGTTFTLLLPLKPATERWIGTPAPVSEEPVETPPETAVLTDRAPDAADELPTVLLVEDNEDFRFYLKDNLRRDYRIIEAANGREGWQKALSAHPHLIVSDISMPHMDGIQLSKKLKADKRTSHIPIILLTALTGDAQEVQGLETGANDYITKPFSFEVLHAKIRNLLELERQLKTTYTRQIKLVQPEVQLQTEDERLLQAVVRCLEEHMTSPQLSVEFLSRQVGMSRSSLYSKVLELTGETPVEYIRSYKLEKAAVLLENSDLTISEVAYNTGFSTPNYFARAFKAKFNMLPSEYVEQKRRRGQDRSKSPISDK